jgi:PAS domain S-box-containing protein
VRNERDNIVSNAVAGPKTTRRDLLELVAGYVEESVLVTSADLDAPGPEILYVNTSFTKMTGYAASELIGKSPRLMQGPMTDRRILDRLKATVAEGGDFISRAINYRRDGSQFELEWIITHLRDQDGKTTHLVAVQRDITGIQRAAAALAEVDDELRVLGARLVTAFEDLEQAERLAAHAQRMNSLGRMARGIGHDLENSLAPMAWILEELEAEPSLQPGAVGRLEQIRTNLDHAISLNQRLLDFAGGKDETPRSSMVVDNAIEEAIDLTRSHGRHRGLRSRSTVPMSRA